MKTTFDPKDKPRNYEVIKKHFDKLNLYEYFDLQIYQKPEELEIESIELGIVAGFAVWSGYSFSISHQILNEIKDSSKPKLKLLILDTDYFSVDFQKKIFGTAMHGYFDCCLVVKGEIIKSHKSKPDVEPFIDTVKKCREEYKS